MTMTMGMTMRMNDDGPGEGLEGAHGDYPHRRARQTVQVRPVWKRLYIQLSAEGPHEHPPQYKALRVQVKVLTIRNIYFTISLVGRDVIWRTLTRVIGEMFKQTLINQCFST